MTLGQRLDDINTKIDKAESAQSYQSGEKQVSRASVASLYAERDRILKKIEMYGSAYVEGQNTKPMKMSANVRFF